MKNESNLGAIISIIINIFSFIVMVLNVITLVMMINGNFVLFNTVGILNIIELILNSFTGLTYIIIILICQLMFSGHSFWESLCFSMLVSNIVIIVEWIIKIIFGISILSKARKNK